MIAFGIICQYRTTSNKNKKHGSALIYIVTINVTPKSFMQTCSGILSKIVQIDLLKNFYLRTALRLKDIINLINDV